MRKKIIALLILGMFILTTVSAVGMKIEADDNTKQIQMQTGNVIFVDDDAAPGGDGSVEHPFQTITEGINAAIEGDTVRVFNGEYDENVFIDKSLDLIGEYQDDTIILGKVELKDYLSHVKIDTFTVTNTIELNCYNDYNIITNTYVTNVPDGDWQTVGIFVWGDYNTISYNTIINIVSNEYIYGIKAYGYNNTVSGNFIKNIKGDKYSHVSGICFDIGSGITISYNTISNIEGGTTQGILVGQETSDFEISDNIISNIKGYTGATGISVFPFSGKNIDITGNTIENIDGVHGGLNFGAFGIELISIFDSNIIGNTIDNTRGGILSVFNKNLVIKDNEIKNTKDCLLPQGGNGLYIMDSSNEQIIGNIFKNNHNDAKFYYNHKLVPGEMLVPGTIPKSYENIRETEGDLSNTWSDNYWGRPISTRKRITGTLLVEEDHPDGGFYFITLSNFDNEPKTRSKSILKDISASYFYADVELINGVLEPDSPINEVFFILRFDGSKFGLMASNRFNNFKFKSGEFNIKYKPFGYEKDEVTYTEPDAIDACFSFTLFIGIYERDIDGNFIRLNGRAYFGFVDI